jgi:hypothetical protein
MSILWIAWAHGRRLGAEVPLALEAEAGHFQSCGVPVRFGNDSKDPNHVRIKPVSRLARDSLNRSRANFPYHLSAKT